MRGLFSLCVSFFSSFIHLFIQHSFTYFKIQFIVLWHQYKSWLFLSKFDIQLQKSKREQMIRRLMKEWQTNWLSTSSPPPITQKRPQLKWDTHTQLLNEPRFSFLSQFYNNVMNTEFYDETHTQRHNSKKVFMTCECFVVVAVVITIIWYVFGSDEIKIWYEGMQITCGEYNNCVLCITWNNNVSMSINKSKTVCKWSRWAIKRVRVSVRFLFRCDMWFQLVEFEKKIAIESAISNKEPHFYYYYSVNIYSVFLVEPKHMCVLCTSLAITSTFISVL